MLSLYSLGFFHSWPKSVPATENGDLARHVMALAVHLYGNTEHSTAKANAHAAAQTQSGKGKSQSTAYFSIFFYR